MKTVAVEYIYSTYEGRVMVNADDDDDAETIIATAKRKLRPHMTLPMACERFWIAGVDGGHGG
jgi:hypothetical protein